MSADALSSRFAVCAALVVSVLFLPTSADAQATFEGLGHRPGGTFSIAYDVSADGAVVVGRSNYANAQGRTEAFVWTAEAGMIGLGDFDGGNIDSEANAVSADGTVVVGWAEGGGAFRWTAQAGLVPLGTLGQNVDYAFGISADGQVIVGWGQTASGRESFRWTQQGGMVSIGALGTTLLDSFASDTSADGSVIAGQSLTEIPFVEPYRWTAAGGMVGLGDVPGGINYGVGYAISDDGEVIVGESISSIGVEAFRWTEEFGLENLDPVQPTQFTSSADGVSADGTLIVGASAQVGGAMVWHEVWGMRGIQDMLVDDYGLDLTGWTLGAARAISADKTTIVGYGINPDGHTEAWRATIPPPVVGDLDGDRTVDVADYTLFASCWSGPGNVARPAGCTRSTFIEADIDADGDVDLRDVARLLAAVDGP